MNYLCVECPYFRQVWTVYPLLLPPQLMLAVCGCVLLFAHHWRNPGVAGAFCHVSIIDISRKEEKACFIFFLPSYMNWIFPVRSLTFWPVRCIFHFSLALFSPGLMWTPSSVSWLYGAQLMLLLLRLGRTYWGLLMTSTVLSSVLIASWGNTVTISQVRTQTTRKYLLQVPQQGKASVRSQAACCWTWTFTPHPYCSQALCWVPSNCPH